MTNQLTMNVPAKPEFVGTVRMAIAHAASSAGFDIEAIDDIKVAVSEACTNIICHAHENADFNYDVILDIADNGLSITVKDKGVGFGLDSYVAPVPGESHGSGLGIFIIRALMDEVDINSEPGTGTNILMTKYLRSKIA